MSSTQDQIEAALRSILVRVGQQDPMYLQRLTEGVQQGNQSQLPGNEFSSRSSAVRESSERCNVAALNGPVQSAYNDNVGLQGFGRVYQNQPTPLTSDNASGFASTGNRMLSSAMSRTPKFSLPQISPLLKRRNTSPRSFVPKEPKRSKEFPIEIVFNPYLGPDSTDDQGRNFFRVQRAYTSKAVQIHWRGAFFSEDTSLGGHQTSRELRNIYDLQPVPDGSWY
ncbi:unnamed protein product [Allacma fusca]|uniref:Uncharacterized protein n=1 Tax=Allacma fusca TaxID=39272 RepID=A0A8J2J578_9HEXA|nr:unnamed protein product [Allacma fusca]